MIGLDTNVVARYLLDDDKKQSLAAKSTIHQLLERGETLAICAPMFLELEWVLRSRPDLSKADVVRMLRSLLELYDLWIEGEEAVEQALSFYEFASVDFGECLFQALYLRMGCTQMMTFDKFALKHLPDCFAPG